MCQDCHTFVNYLLTLSLRALPHACGVVPMGSTCGAAPRPLRGGFSGEWVLCVCAVTSREGSRRAFALLLPGRAFRRGCRWYASPPGLAGHLRCGGRPLRGGFSGEWVLCLYAVTFQGSTPAVDAPAARQSRLAGRLQRGTSPLTGRFLWGVSALPLRRYFPGGLSAEGGENRLCLSLRALPHACGVVSMGSECFAFALSLPKEAPRRGCSRGASIPLSGHHWT